MQRTESKSWSGKNDIVPRTPRFSNHVVKGGMKQQGKARQQPESLLSTKQGTHEKLSKTIL